MNRRIIIFILILDLLSACPGYTEKISISYALNLTNGILIKKKKTIVNRTFNAGFSLKLDTIELISEYWWPAHTVDNIVTCILKYNILFGGCMVKELAAKNLGNIADADVKEWPRTVEKVKGKYRTAEIVITGHGQYGGMELLDHTIELCK